MARWAICVGLLAAVAGCASRAPVVGAPLDGPRATVTYSCVKTLVLRVRIDGSSASVTIDNDGPYVLPQTSGRLDFTIYSDGQRTLQIYRNQVSLGIGRGQLEPCSR